MVTGRGNFKKRESDKKVQSIRDEIGFKKVLHSEKSDLPYNSTLGIGKWGRQQVLKDIEFELFIIQVVQMVKI